MEFTNNELIHVPELENVKMEREINRDIHSPATYIDFNTSSMISSRKIEYDREKKDALEPKPYTTKETNIEELPFLLTDYLSTEQKHKYYRGLKKDVDTTDGSYYVLSQGIDGFELYRVKDWYTFVPTSVDKSHVVDDGELPNRDAISKSMY